MQNDINKIRELCETYRTEPKLLLIPSRSMKTQILKTLADYDINPLNLSVINIKDLAYSIAANHILKENLTPIDFKETAEIITDLLKGLQIKKELLFLDKIEVTFGISKAISKTVLELLDNGYSHSFVNLDKIDNKKKQADLTKIIDEYISIKKNGKYIDYTDITNLAINILQEQKPEYVSCYALEVCVFSLMDVKLLESLNMKFINTETGINMESVYDLSLQAENVSFFEAYGDYNEAKEVLRLIFNKKVPFDNVLIVAPSGALYTQLFYQLMQQYTMFNDKLHNIKELPITFGSGLPLLLSSPAKLLALLLDWVGSGYRSHELINIFSSDMFDIKTDQKDNNGNLPERDELFGKLDLINLIKRSNLTWQRHSYIPCLNNHLNYLKSRGYENVKTEKAVSWLIDFVNYAFDLIPEPDKDGLVDIEILMTSLKDIISKYKRIYSALDSQGLRVTLQELSTSLKGRRVNINEAVEIINSHMQEINILCESPTPGKIHFTTYKNASWIERKYIYVMGLGADNFPGMSLEDPLLLDIERHSPPMKSSIDLINQNIKIMYAFLNNLKGYLTCSYSCFDTIEIRESYPSTLFYKLRELYPNEPLRQIDFIQEDESSFIDSNDYWTHHGIKSGAALSVDDESDEIINDVIDNDFEDDLEKSIWVDSGEYIRQGLTATSLTDYLSCKYKFFLKHVLGLKEIREEEFDALGWLSALETGNVYHKIIENFNNQIINSPEILYDVDKAMKLIQDIAENEIAIFEVELPTASPYHTKRQTDEIMENIKKFVEREIENAPNRKVLHAEFEFGSEPPVIIDVGEGRKIKAFGKIDRVDKLQDGSIEIIDYKTGGTWSFQNLQSPEEVGLNEANTQLALYYLALKEISGNNTSDITDIGNISKMSYVFLTAKGDYDVISMVPSNESQSAYKSTFLDIYKEIEKGIFTPHKGILNYTDDEELEVNCKFCGYVNACKYSLSSEEV